MYPIKKRNLITFTILALWLIWLIWSIDHDKQIDRKTATILIWIAIIIIFKVLIYFGIKKIETGKNSGYWNIQRSGSNQRKRKGYFTNITNIY